MKSRYLTSSNQLWNVALPLVSGMDADAEIRTQSWSQNKVSGGTCARSEEVGA